MSERALQNMPEGVRPLVKRIASPDMDDARAATKELMEKHKEIATEIGGKNAELDLMQICSFLFGGWGGGADGFESCIALLQRKL